MADLLVKHLKNKSAEHSALNLLASQWDFDERLIPKALQTISGLFPHYSRHDESHSKQILVNIERLLGENISLLSATDTWLILEAAYWHDIGMVVPHADLEKAINEPGFSDYVESLCAQPYHDLHAFACAFRNRSDTGLIFENNSPIEMLIKLREFLAEWFRRKHPERAEEIVRSPMASIGLSSPRTELIPARLFRMLGRVCQMHGSTFKDLMAPGGLPFRESGLGQDDCHPRFVACMLRMGDLLDLDDNRFCPVMQGIAGEHRSPLSKAHEDKHAGMRHLRIDPERIELSAECETIDGYLEAFKWFDWLQQEVANQRENWRDIVPNRELGLLPTLGPISVKLSGDLQILKDGERPAFTLDSEKAIKLLQGENLYGSKLACIRELLQNAVDATLLKLWLTNKMQHISPTWDSPDNSMGLLESLPIVVTLEEMKKQDVTSDKTTWHLKIRDCGTGITQSDLEFMLRIGSSQKNLSRQKVIQQMPEWMKPSGAFGIGLQSAFMLCDELSIVTKNITNNDIFSITMYSPTGPKNGLVVFRKLPADLSHPYGTEISLKLELDAFPEDWSVNNEETTAFKIVQKHDPILDNSLPYQAASIFDKVADFAQSSLIPITGSLTTSDDKYDLPDADHSNNDKGADSWRFIEIENIQLRMQYKPHIAFDQDETFLTFYRGQYFQPGNLHIPNVDIKIDILSGTADSWLSFNRDKVSQNAHAKLKNLTLKALMHCIEKDLDAPHDKRFDRLNCCRKDYSLFLKIMEYHYGEQWAPLANILGDAWTDLKPKTHENTIRDCLRLSSFTLAATNYMTESYSSTFDITFYESDFDVMSGIILKEWSKKTNSSIKITTSEFPLPESLLKYAADLENTDSPLEDNRRIQTLYYSLKLSTQDPWDDSAISTKLNAVVRSNYGNSRYFFYANQEFQSLSLKPGTELNAFNIFDHDLNRNKVLLPFLFLGNAQEQAIKIQLLPQQLEKLSRWTQQHLIHWMEIEEISAAYKHLASYIDKIMVHSKGWTNARCE
nr:hypothetical protein FFPRI1PSEUD_33210 [Pseudomonas sp. FFPRI_1]